MSILLVEVVPQGIIFGADRNVTFTRKRVGNGGLTTIEIHGQSQRAKVLRWPEWLYDFIGGHLTFSSFEALSDSLRSEVEKQRRIDEGEDEPEPLIIHLGGFEKRDGVLVPVIWYITNARKNSSKGHVHFRKEFQHSEEFWKYFKGVGPREIQSHLDQLAREYNPFWFHQGFDLGTFNLIEGFLKAAFKALCDHHPDHSLPQTLPDWERQVKMSILTYAAYFQAFKGPSEQFVGGGADTVSIKWP
jgi:hypothetical protein